MTRDSRNKDHIGAAFIEPISIEALNSAAVRHPYLSAMREGDFPNVDLAHKDFALQYGLYSSKFTHYVSAVIRNLSSADHRQILMANLAEEQGHVHDVDLPPDVLASVVGQPHARLYGRFQEALGLDTGSRESTPQCPGLLWSQTFLELCETNECVGLGAIGIGTEYIVASIFDQILAGLKAHSDLTMKQRVFFDLHSECDEKHAAQMLSITEGLAQNRESCDQIEYGIHAAIDMRASFWGMMLERALSFPTCNSTTVEKLSAVGNRKSL